MKLLIAILVLVSAATTFGAGWPARVFAPYMYIGADDHFQITQCDDACGQKFYTIAFIIADKQHNPAWDGRVSMGQNLYADQITTIRGRGGDVIVSFGGADGTELAIAETNAAGMKDMGKVIAALRSKYAGQMDFGKASGLVKAALST